MYSTYKDVAKVLHVAIPHPPHGATRLTFLHLSQRTQAITTLNLLATSDT